MTENNAAQPGLTDDEIKAIRDSLGGGFLGPVPFARAVERTLLSKLRAEGVQAGDERAQHGNWYSRTHMHEYSREATWRGWQARAALASAPAAGEAQGVSVERLAKDPFLAAQLWRNPVDRAPVAGEAQPTEAQILGIADRVWREQEQDPTDKSAVLALVREVLGVAHVAREAMGYSTGIQWRPRQSEQSIKLTRNPQPEYGFVHALYSAPQASEAQCPRCALPLRQECNCDEGYTARAELQASEAMRPALAVWYGSMPELNGKSNWTAILHRKGDGLMDGPHITIDRSEYPDRVRYEADRLRFLIGEIDKEPWILDYDADKCDAPQADKDGGDCAKGAGDEPIAWESTTAAYIKFITDSRYQKFAPAVRKWYRPYRCPTCAALSPTQPTEQGERDE